MGVLMLLLAACSTDPQPTPASQATVLPPAKAVAPALELSLDGDTKWPLDDHTRAVMAEIRSSIQSSELTSEADVARLHTALQGQMDRLIQGCTMDGAAHDELHVFLMAWIPLVDGLKGADPARGATIKQTLERYLVSFDQHFA